MADPSGPLVHAVEKVAAHDPNPELRTSAGAVLQYLREAHGKPD